MSRYNELRKEGITQTASGYYKSIIRHFQMSPGATETSLKAIASVKTWEWCQEMGMEPDITEFYHRRANEAYAALHAEEEAELANYTEEDARRDREEDIRDANAYWRGNGYCGR